MYLNAIVLWTCTIVGCVITEVRSKRFTSPQHLFSEEPNIFDENFHAAQNERFERSTDEEQSHRRSRRNSPIPRRVTTDPVITKSVSLRDLHA